MVKERISLRQLYGEVAGLPIENIQIEVERDGKNLVLDRAAIEALYAMDTTGRLHAAVDSSGRFTEASSLSTYNTVTYLLNRFKTQGPLVAAPSDVTTAAQANAERHMVYTVPITIAAGGAVTNVALHATLAGYKFHFKVLGIEMDTTDATTTWWFHTTAGGVSCIGCPASPGFSPVALTATTVNTQLTGAYMNNGAATGDVTLLDVAGVGAGAANGFIYLEGWFETT